jgi:cystathionine gamma-synthase
MRSPGQATDAVWAGEEGRLLTGATVVPVSLGVAHGYPDVESWQAVALGRTPGHIYARNTNPTVEAFEEKIRVLEGAEDATSFATGMAAISNTLFALLKPGDRVVSVKDTYGGTSQIFLSSLPGGESRSSCARRRSPLPSRPPSGVAARSCTWRPPPTPP